MAVPSIPPVHHLGLLLLCKILLVWLASRLLILSLAASKKWHYFLQMEGWDQENIPSKSRALSFHLLCSSGARLLVRPWAKHMKIQIQNICSWGNMDIEKAGWKQEQYTSYTFKCFLGNTKSKTNLKTALCSGRLSLEMWGKDQILLLQPLLEYRNNLLRQHLGMAVKSTVKNYEVDWFC